MHSTDSSKPISLMLYVIDKCNMNCPYCYNVFPRSQTYLEQELIFKFINDIYSKTCRHIDVRLIGGEPALYPDAIRLVRRLRQTNFISQIELFTNFSFPIGFYNDVLKHNVKLACSWHAECDDKHFCKKLMLLSQQHMQNIAEIAMMFEHQNFRRWKNVISVLNNKFHNVIKPWILYDKNSIYEYSQQQIELFVDTIMQFKLVDMKKFIHSNDLHANIFKHFSDCYAEKFVSMSCSAGVDSYYVHANGDVYRCQNEFYYCIDPIYNINSNNGTFDKSFYHTTACKCQFCRHGNFGVDIR